LKEFTVHDLQDYDDGIMEGLVFCRKRITLTRTEKAIHLEGEPSVPIGDVLTSENHVGNLHHQIQAWKELDMSLLGFETALPDGAEIADSLRRMFLLRYPSVQPIRTSTARQPTGRIRMLKRGDVWITDEALAVVCSIPAVRCGDYLALTTFYEQLHHCLCTERVSIVVIGEEDEKRDLVVAPNERGCGFVLRKKWERLVLREDRELVETLKLILPR
jgi:hypothetical protein